MKYLTIEIPGTQNDPILAPCGIATPYQAIVRLTVVGGDITGVATEPELGLSAALILPEGGPVVLRYAIDTASFGGGYPDAAFQNHRNRFTSAADELIAASRKTAEAAGGGRAGIEALVADTETRFAYSHPENKFNDGMDAIPYLACGLTPGSCVDINTYLVASLRSAGYEAAYVYGFFFPEERAGVIDDGHCWVVTRHDGEVLEWDIAHHLKAELGPTRPGLNPLRGERVALSHSMGHRYVLPDGPLHLKLLGEPMRVSGRTEPEWMSLFARLEADQEHI